ncbi:DUF2577 domain-containing protein [Paenibacillus sanguinis]|uniref:DUF2577 domain-containing protein n=1 Tax=Paenibacillus sanguinis TaxID=225906 RepID=UPI0004775BA0
MANKIRQLGVGAVDASSPVSVLFGKVMNTAPLEILVDQRFTIDQDFLIVPQQMTRYELDLTHHHTFDGGVTSNALLSPLDLKHNHVIEGAATGDALLDPIELSHSHTYVGGDTGEALPGKIVIREGLKVGDNVMLLRIQGGQKYVVWDKVVSG